MQKLFRNFGLVILSSFVIGHSSLATPVMFPLVQMHAGATYTKTFTLTSYPSEITDGTNLYVGTFYQVTPSGGTNPIVQMVPNNYLLTFQDSKTPLRFGVPASTGMVNVLTLITNGLLSLTNWISSPATSAAYATNAGTSAVATNLSASSAFPSGSVFVDATHGIINIGDWSNQVNGASVIVADNVGQVTINALNGGISFAGPADFNGSLFVTGGVAGGGLLFAGNEEAVIGDIAGSNHDTVLTVDDNAQRITANANNGYAFVGGPLAATGFISTNGAGATSTVWVQTNSVGPHGYGLEYTNGLFIGTKQY